MGKKTVEPDQDGDIISRLWTRVNMADIQRAFHRARSDLADVGLLREGKYLDTIECYRAWMPSLFGEMGYVYDRGVDYFSRLAGFDEGAIYIAPNAPVERRAHGYTLLDVMRHEFGHAWAWLDPEFLEQDWFEAAFGSPYGDERRKRPSYTRDDFVTEYATTSPAEDFADTFMFFLKYRRSLQRFKTRPGAYRKILAVARAVTRARRQRVHLH